MMVIVGGTMVDIDINVSSKRVQSINTKEVKWIKRKKERKKKKKKSERGKKIEVFILGWETL